jgi:signal transduction histidine kinase
MPESSSSSSSSEKLLLATAGATALLQRPATSDVTGELLRNLGEATGADRAYFVSYDSYQPGWQGGGSTGEPQLEWTAPGSPRSGGPAPGEQADTGRYARWFARMSSGGAICGIASEFPPDEQELLRDLGVRSLLAVPVPAHDGLHGLLGFDACRSERIWTDAERVALSAVGAALGVALDRKRAQHAARAALEAGAEEERVSTAIASFTREALARLRDPALSDWMCRRIAELLDCDAAFAVTWREEEQAVLVSGTHGLTPAAREVLALLRGTPAQVDAVFGAVFARDDVSVAEGPSPEFAGLGLNADVTWRIRLALRRDGQLAGAVSAFRRNREEGFRPSDVRLARGIAQVASLAFESARLVSDLGRATRLESRFVATMSHELRTPLNVVIGYLEILRDGDFGKLSEEQRGLVDRASRSAMGLAAIVQGGLDLGRVGGQAGAVNVGEIGLAPLLASAVDVFSERARAKGLATRVTVSADAGTMRSDGAKIDAIARNLVGNAVKFTPRGEVEVGARRAGDWVEIFVRDSGIGIPRESFEEVFEPFRQLDPSGQAGGVGLGLHVVNRLVGVLGGRIEVESEVGRGSTFRVFLRDLRNVGPTSRPVR